MDWRRLLNGRRLGEGKAPKESPDVRSPFDRDADRVMFSGPFRRMARKTQVHPLAANDHVHTRLTHSLETGQVGRSLGRRIFEFIPESEVPENVTQHDIGSIVQAACLAHDIGNPPFGHAGEEAMAHWFETNRKRFSGLPSGEGGDLSHYDGNAQGFRILTQIENHVFGGGLRLTYATLGTFLKYPRTPAAGERKFSVFASEEENLRTVASEVGLATVRGGYARHPLAYLVEAADDICYCVIDVEDAVELGILPFEDAQSLLMTVVPAADRDDVNSLLADSAMFRVNFSRLRGHVFRALIDGATGAFREAQAGILRGEGPKDLFTALDLADPCRVFVEKAKELGRTKIYLDEKKVEVELGAFATLDVLLSAFCDAAKECAGQTGLSEGSLGWKSRLTMRLLGDHAPKSSNAPAGGWTEYQCYRRVIDFVGGMTDNYATYMAKQIGGMGFTGLQRP